MSTTLSVKSIDVSYILAKSSKARGTATLAVAQAIQRDSNPYVPFAHGALRNSAKVEVKSDTMATLTYGGGGVKYARPQYYRTDYKHTTPGTQAKWFDAAKARNKSRWVREAETAVRGLMHG